MLLGVLERDLESVEHDTAELLDVVLLPGLAAVPAERVGQLGGLHRQTLGGLCERRRHRRPVRQARPEDSRTQQEATRHQTQQEATRRQTQRETHGVKSQSSA